MEVIIDGGISLLVCIPESGEIYHPLDQAIVVESGTSCLVVSVGVQSRGGTCMVLESVRRSKEEQYWYRQESQKSENYRREKEQEKQSKRHGTEKYWTCFPRISYPITR